MLAFIKGLGGLAGGIAGLFPYLPLIAVGIAAAVALGWGALQAHDAQAQRDQNTVLQTKVETLSQNLGVAESAIKTDDETIKQMMANEISNDKLIEQQSAAIDDADKQATATANQIRTLQANDADVQKFLRTPIPASLAGVYNHRPATSDATGPVSKGNSQATPKADTVHH